MANFDLIMPKMGESVAEATIIKWTKKEGDSVKLDETVLEIATDKVDSEIPSPFEGVLIKCLFKEGDVVQVGSVIGVISSDEKSVLHPIVPPTHIDNSAKPVVTPEINISNSINAEKTQNNYKNSDKFYSPLVKSIAKEEGISITELDAIMGSGQDGRVTKADILNYLPNRNKPSSITTKPENSTTSSLNSSQNNFTINRPAVSVGAEDEVIEMDRMRKIIAENMVMSKHVAPHVTSYVEADVTNLVLWRDKAKKEF